MSSYHSSFTYLNKNSSGEGFAIASFEPDSGFVDSFLGMDQITTDSYDGTKKHFYGSKYNTTATISITLVKYDKSDFSMEDNRRALRWLTGCRQASWLDLYVDDALTYSFYGNVTSCQQHKLDARVIGIKIEFSSIHPWAWSAPQSFDCYIGEKTLMIDADGEIYKEDGTIGIDEKNGVVFNDSTDTKKTFNMTSDGVIYNGEYIDLLVDNQTDDLYSYTYLDIVYENKDASELIINNLSLDETIGKTVIKGIGAEEKITIISGKFIISDNAARIFGDDFNFVWPKLCPGINNLAISGDGIGSVHFTYRYPMKIGDCAIDVDNLNRNPYCEGDISGAVGSVNGITTIPRKNVMLVDETTDVSYTVSVKDSYLYVTESENSRNSDMALIDVEDDNAYKITVNDDYLYVSNVPELDIANGRDSIVLIDETSNTPYELISRKNRLYLSEI